MEPGIKGSQGGEEKSKERSDWNSAVSQTFLNSRCLPSGELEAEPGYREQRDLELLRVGGLEAAQDRYRGSEGVHWSCAGHHLPGHTLAHDPLSLPCPPAISEELTENSSPR